MTAMGVRDYENSKAKVPWGSQIKCSRTCLNSTFVISSFVALKSFTQEAAVLSDRNYSGSCYAQWQKSPHLSYHKDVVYCHCSNHDYILSSVPPPQKKIKKYH